MAGQRRAGASLTCLPRLVHTCRAAGLSVTHTKAIKQDSRSVWHCSVPTSKCQSIEAWHSHHSLRAWLAEPDWRHYSPARISTPPIRILLGQVQGDETGPPCQRLKYLHHLEGSVATAVTLCMLHLKQEFQSLRDMHHFPLPTVICLISELDQAHSKIIQNKGCTAACIGPLQRDFSMVESSFAS